MAEPPVRIGITRVDIPPRRDDMPAGTELMRSIRNILGDTHNVSDEELMRRRAQVEELIYREVNRGNVPDFMRPENWREITVETQVGGRTVQARVRVCPDYLAVGDNSDYVRVPLSPLTAQRIADRFGFVLPTSRLVDIIDAEARRVNGMLPFVAALQVAERVIDPATQRPVREKWNLQRYGFYEGRWMLSAEFANFQNQIIHEQVREAGTPPLRSGFKKDVVYDPLVFKQSQEGGPPVVIYRRGIQPLSNFHNEKYHDYSHGIRFLDSNVRLTITERDGTRREESMSMRDVLMHRDYYRLFAPAQMDINKMYRGSISVPRRTGEHTLLDPSIVGRRQTRQPI